MEHDTTPPSRARENMLAIALTIMAAAAIYFFLDFVTMGFMSGLVAGVMIFAVVAIVHYLTWGRAFSDEVAAEREALKRKDQRPAQAKMPAEAIQDISRTQGIQKK